MRAVRRKLSAIGTMPVNAALCGRRKDMERTDSHAARMIARRMAAVPLAVAFPAGCGCPPSRYQLFSALRAERFGYGSNSVRAFLLRETRWDAALPCEWAHWLGSRLIPDDPPQPSGIFMVFDWRIMGWSRVCLWAKPLIGDMPSISPAFYECLQVLRAQAAPYRLEAIVARQTKFRKIPLKLYPLKVFPAPVIERYLGQSRVLCRGRIPEWAIPEPMRVLERRQWQE